MGKEERPKEAVGWEEAYIRSVVDARGESCGNCGCWRRLVEHMTIEKCPRCNDEAFDIYRVVEKGELLP